MEHQKVRASGKVRMWLLKAAPFLTVFGNNFPFSETAECTRWNLSGSCKHGVTCRFLHNAASVNVSTPAGPVAVSESAVAHAPPASEHGSGRDRSPDAASGVRRKSRSRSKNGKKAEAGAAVAHAADASSEKLQWLFKCFVCLLVSSNAFLFCSARVCCFLPFSCCIGPRRRKALLRHCLSYDEKYSRSSELSRTAY